MSVRLPPIAALRALEASARRLSYTRAAEELHVTQSAISHQIRHIEELWGLKLFGRRGRQLVLTPEGQAIVPIVRDFMDRMTGVLKQLRADDDRGSVRVSLVQSFAFKWLVPRLGHFNEQHPDVDVWISTSEDLVDFGSDELDLAIRLCRGECPDLHSTLLLREYVFPVCSPRFLERVTPPEGPADLLRLPLLYRHSDDICPRWRDWFHDAGVEVRRLPKGSHFSDTSMAVQAAIDDQGIALARSAHVEDDLAAGRLRKLFDVYSPSNVAYYIVCPPGSENLTRIKAFREWLLAEAAVSQAEYDRIAGPPPEQAAALAQ
ncbi:MAG: transcriptional regulator GcvA [Gammaproteobacteria bacterium]